MSMKVSANNEVQKLVAVRDLPIYPPEKSVTDYHFAEDAQLPLENKISEMRRALSDNYKLFAEKFKPVDRAVQSAKNSFVSANEYFQHEKTVLPKAAAITFGGVAGYILFFRRYGLKKYFSAIGGLVTMSAFCYPYEAIDIAKVGIAHAQRTYEEFKKAP